MTDLDVHLPAIQAGDADAFARWMAGAELRLRAALRPWASGIDAESVLQETLLRVWQLARRVQVDGQGNSLYRFALRTARNLAISDWRRHRRQVPLPDEDGSIGDAGADDPGDPPVDPILGRAIARCVDHLPPAPARALRARLAAAGGLPDAELAESLAMVRNTFLQNLFRARQLLTRCLARAGIELAEVWR